MTSVGLNDLLDSAWHRFIELFKVRMVYCCQHAPADSCDSLSESQSFIANLSPPAGPQTLPAGPQIPPAGPQTPLADPQAPLDKWMDGQTDGVREK